MSEEIRIIKERFDEKILISSKTLEKIKFLIDEYRIEIDKYKKDISIDNIIFQDESYIKMDSTDFWPIFAQILEKGMFHVELKEKGMKNCEFPERYTILLCSLIEKFDKLYPAEKRKSIGDLVEEIDDKSTYEFLDLIYQIEMEIKNIDLFNLKENCLENMRYFSDDITISRFSNEYDNAFQNRDINKMNSMLDYVCQQDLKEWDKYIGDLDLMTDEKFSFIGHSTMSLFENNNHNHYHNYVSSSLFNQDLNEGYSSRHGLILPPKNIVAARSRDLYIDNGAKNEKELETSVKIIKKIDHPQKIIDEEMQLLEENLAQNTYAHIYSEIVIKGFEPIGIFCFTDGSKNFNVDYKQAQELQKTFPHLKIYNFDVMKRKKGRYLDVMKVNLINSLYYNTRYSDEIPLCYRNQNYISMNDDLSKYDYFFEEFEKIKQKENYTEDEIAAIFKENYRLLNSYIEPDYLFSNYEEKWVKFILEKNEFYGIEDILNGKSDTYKFSQFSELYPYKDRLSSMYDGIDEFLTLLTKISPDDEMVSEINESNPTNFYDISKMLSKYLSDSLKKYNEIKNEIQERENIEKQYEYYNSIYLRESYVQRVKKEYKELISNIDIIEQKEKLLLTELSKIMNDLNEIDNKIKLLDNSKYVENSENISCEKLIEEIKLNIAKLSKHPFINRKKIKKEKSRLELTEDEYKKEKIRDLNFEKNDLQQKKKNVESDLSYVQNNKNFLQRQFKKLKSEIQEHFKCESIDEIDLIIYNKEKFMNQYNCNNNFCLEKLKIQLENISHILKIPQNDLNDFKEEVVTVIRTR